MTVSVGFFFFEDGECLSAVSAPSSFALLSSSPTTFLVNVTFWTFLLPSGEVVADNDTDEDGDKQTGSFWSICRLTARTGLSSKVGVSARGGLSSKVGVSLLEARPPSETGISSNGNLPSELGLSSRRGFPNTGHWVPTTGMFGLIAANGASISLLASSPKFFDLISLARWSCISFGARFFSLRGLRDLDRWLLLFLFPDLSACFVSLLLPVPSLSLEYL